MKDSALLPPIEHEQFTQVLLRVAVKLVELDYRKNPDLYSSYPPLRVLGLADEYRAHLGFPCFHGTLIYISKALASGYRLREIPLYSPQKVWRSIRKRAPGLRRG